MIQVQAQGLWPSEKESIAFLCGGEIRCIAQCLAQAESQDQDTSCKVLKTDLM